MDVIESADLIIITYGNEMHTFDYREVAGGHQNRIISL